MTTWLVILAVGVGSFLFRVGPLLLLERRPLGDRADRTIRHGGTAAITALIATSALHSAQGGAATPTVIAVGAAAVLAVRGWTMLRIVASCGALYAVIVVLTGLLSH